MKKYVINKKIKKGVNILQLEAETIFKYKLSFQKLIGCTEKNGVKEYNKKIFFLNYSANLDYSLELNKLFSDNNNIIKNKYNHKYINDIVSVTVTKSFKKWDNETNKMIVVYNTKDLRKKIYNEGFDIINEETGEVVHYVFYKRTSSSARQSKCLFIREELLEKMYKYSFMNLNVTKGILNELLTYSSLTLSSLDQNYDFFKLDKDEILIVDDVYKKEVLKNVITYKDNEDYSDLLGSKKDEEKTFNLTDGEGLIDVKVFKEVLNKKNGMALLRNKWLKCCALSSNLKQYFKDNKIKEVTDMFNRKMKASKIKLIITPSSLKFMKLSNQFFKNDQDCYDYWLNNMDLFGVCKTDHKYKNRLTYQFLNAYNFTKEEMYDLSKDDIEKINNLRTNLDYFKNYLKEKEDNVYTHILNINKNFQYTKYYKNKRNKIVRKYVNEIRRGKFTADNSNYYTVFSSPEVLLQEACNQDINLVLENNLPEYYEILCNDYADLDDLVCFRNPFINRNSSCVLKNCNSNKRDFYNKYFNIQNSYVCICVGTSICLLNGGMDFDSDTICIIKNNIIYNKVKDVFKNIIYLDMNVKADSLIQDFNNQNIALNDDKNSKNLIGEIVNLSAKINTYINHLENTEEDNKELIDKLMDYSNKLSLLSNIEIDKAKKSFMIDSRNIIKNISKETNLDKPLFFKYTCSNNKKSKLSKNKKFVEYDSALDKVDTIIKEKLNRTKNPNLEITDVMTYNLVNTGISCKKINRRIRDLLLTSDFVSISLKKLGEDINNINQITKEDLVKIFDDYTLTKDQLYKILRTFQSKNIVLEALYESKYKEDILDLFR